jgi:queuosine precursor transporter
MFKIKRFDFLVSFYIFSIMVAELLGSKTFPLFEIGNFKLSASVAIFVIPFLFSITDIITEVYGKERTRSVIRSGLIMIFFVLLFSLLAINLPPSSRFLETEAAYDTVFGKSIRISAASLIAFGTAEFLDVFIFSKIREKLGKKKLWLRNNVSNFVSQLVDTTLFITLAFYSFGKPFGDNYSFLVGLIIPYWLLKCSLSVIETPLVYAGVKWLKNDKTNKSS